MTQSTFTNSDERDAIARALDRGDAQRAFTLLADYLTRNKITLSDELFRLYLERELFACLKGRGHIFDTI